MKACIFDLDGTLTDTLDSLVYSVNLTLQEMGLTEISRDQCRRFVGNAGIWQSLRGELYVPCSTLCRDPGSIGRAEGQRNKACSVVE